MKSKEAGEGGGEEKRTGAQRSEETSGGYMTRHGARDTRETQKPRRTVETGADATPARWQKEH